MDLCGGSSVPRPVASVAFRLLAPNPEPADTELSPRPVSGVSAHNLRIAAATLILFGAFLALQPISYAWEIEACLDRGGTFDYENHRCDFDVSHPAGSAMARSAIYFGLALISFAGGLRLASAAGKRTRMEETGS